MIIPNSMVDLDEFRITGPAVIGVSGGRTSGYMLRLILDAHGGTLPDDVRAVFCNTGKEMPETLDFVQLMSRAWAVPITWLEYRPGKGVAEVSYETASRDGEPFAHLIGDRSFLPNPVARFCTAEMKVLATERHAKAVWGWTEYTDVIGFRADEPERKLTSRSEGVGKYAPLLLAGITNEDVLAFWRDNAFDLSLPSINGKTVHGNCDLCFLKGARQIVSLIREKPERAVWWAAQEQRINSTTNTAGGATFRSDRPSYTEMALFAASHDEMFPFPDDDELLDCHCTG